ncbi:alpha/beta hydrolase family protein [Halarcobacter bivalviorum]|nr:alpha/beta hydrolase family protein [Halarcobacter bivalviorum]
MIPGLMCNEKLWSKIELNNYKSLPIPKEDSIEKMIKSLDKTISKEEKKVNIIGFSLGGYLSLNYLTKYPNKVNKVLVVSSSINNLSSKEILLRQNNLKRMDTHKIRTLSNKAICQLLEDKNDTENISLIKEMFDDLGVDTYKQQLLATLERENLFNMLKEVSNEVLFIASNNDSLVDLTNIKKLCNTNKNFDLKLLDSSSHMIPLEYDYFLYKEILNFF